MTIGSLKNLYAWKNTMPTDPHSLHVTGLVTVLTPCHDVSEVYTGDSDANPPIYQLSIRSRESPDPCIQIETDKSFHYIENNYAGSHKEVEVSTESDTQTIKIEITS